MIEGGTLKKPLKGQQSEFSPVSRNLQFNNMMQSQTLLDHGGSPQVRPPEAHSHTRNKLKNQVNTGAVHPSQVQSTGPHMILRQSKNKQMYHAAV